MKRVRQTKPVFDNCNNFFAEGAVYGRCSSSIVRDYLYMNTPPSNACSTLSRNSSLKINIYSTDAGADIAPAFCHVKNHHSSFKTIGEIKK